MYRLLQVGGASLRKYPKLSFCNFSENNEFLVTDKTCHLCKQLNNNISKVLSRNQSTSTSPNLNVSKKRKKRKLKRYAELLVVTENSSKQQRASVQKLTSADLKLLATTNLNLSELYKLKEFSKDMTHIKEHTYNNLAIIENLPNVSDNVSNSFMLPFDKDSDQNVINCNIPLPKIDELDPLVKEEIIENNPEESVEFVPDVATVIVDHETELDIDSIHKQSTFQPEIIEDHPEVSEVEVVKKAKDKKYKTYDPRAHEEIAAKTLAGYIEVCSVLKIPQKGLSAIHFHRNRTRRSKTFIPIKDVKVYNTVLRGFANRGDFNKIKEVLHIIEQDNVQLNIHSYVSIFECLGRINIQENHLKDLRIFTKDAKMQNIQFDDIMSKGIFLNDERDIVLKALRAVDPNYVPKYNFPILQYKNHLVDHLNKEEQLEVKEDKQRNFTGLFTPEIMQNFIQNQISCEIEGQVTVKSIESRTEPTEEVLKYRKIVEDHYKTWEENAHAAFIRDLATLTAQRSPMNYESFMRCIPVKDFVKIILDEAKKLAQGSETYSPTVNMLYRDMGSKVYARYLTLRKQKTGVLDKMQLIHTEYCNDYAACHGKLDILPKEEVLLNTRQQWQLIEHSFSNSGSTLDMGHEPWTPTQLTSIGKFLYHIVMHDLKVDVNSLRLNSKHKNYLPAFYTIFRTQGRIVKEEVKPHPVLSKLYRASVPETLTFPSYEIPMRCPPVPWSSFNKGGYLIAPCDVIRLPSQAVSQKQRMSDASPEQLYPSLDALNQLASIPWKVNRKILDVILKVFTSGGSSKLDVPEHPSILPPPRSITADMDKTERFQVFRQKLQYRRKKAEMYSLWCDCLYRLSLANHFRNDLFWLPHNMDFRGRVYPIPPHLNHLGSDLARSMLVFAENRPLGPEGLNWLKLHLINLTGLKKRDPVSERLKYAEDVMDLILDSADNPLDGKKWWVESDEPWQTLACCMEIAEAVRSPNPEEFRSHFPIHQDGSCNGLQHYAALGRDSAGAHSVNLTSSEVPQDVYSAVVTLVEEQRQRDAHNGLEIAKTLEGFVKRKVIKQTVMTTVYGVTRFGARLQIAKQLKDIDDFPKDSVWAASSYLTSRTFESLRSMFTSTREIQDWFTECARLISAVGGQHVEWVTPLGLPIVQPYFRYKKLSSSQGYEPFSLDKYEKPNVMKQKNAFPPNFIHSLDSSHMMLTSLHCERAGITFVSVHDCYWTHASTVHIMNQICREQFVALHSEPILDDLSVFLTEKYRYSDAHLTGDGSVVDLTKRKLNRVLTQLPNTGDFDIRQVLKSVYFFS